MPTKRKRSKTSRLATTPVPVAETKSEPPNQLRMRLVQLLTWLGDHILAELFVAVCAGVIVAILLGQFPRRDNAQEDITTATPTMQTQPFSSASTPTSVATPARTATPTPTDTPVPISTPIGGGGGQIAFVSDREGNQDIYVMRVDGSEQKRLTASPFNDFYPAWSPEGPKIAYLSERDYGFESDDGLVRAQAVSLYVVNSDGGNETRLTDKVLKYWPPVWSPDGSKIAFSSYYKDSWSIAIIGISPPEQIIVLNIPTTDLYPVWSPDGSRLAFACWYPQEINICTMNSDGSGFEEIWLPGYSSSPHSLDWAPVGARLAMVFSGSIADSQEIYTFSFSRYDQYPRPKRLTSSGNNTSPGWSPDGTMIVFVSKRDGNKEIYVMNSDGTAQKRLTENSADDEQPVWSPDGSRIAFASNRDGNWEIYIMNADGSNQIRLTNSPAEDRNPVWQP